MFNEGEPILVQTRGTRGSGGQKMDNTTVPLCHARQCHMTYNVAPTVCVFCRYDLNKHGLINE